MGPVLKMNWSLQCTLDLCPIDIFKRKVNYIKKVFWEKGVMTDGSLTKDDGKTCYNGRDKRFVAYSVLLLSTIYIIHASNISYLFLC